MAGHCCRIFDRISHMLAGSLVVSPNGVTVAVVQPARRRRDGRRIAGKHEAAKLRMSVSTDQPRATASYQMISLSASIPCSYVNSMRLLHQVHSAVPGLRCYPESSLKGSITTAVTLDRAMPSHLYIFVLSTASIRCISLVTDSPWSCHSLL